MSDSEKIIHLLTRVEWRLRTSRLRHEIALALSLLLAFLVVFKLWDLFFPLTALTVTLLSLLSAVLFTTYLILCFRNKGTLEEAAVSIDRRAGLNDEMRTAIWFIRSPRPSEWITNQIHRAANTAAKIDLLGLYPGPIPRACYLAMAMLLVFIGLNFAPLPLNQNWLLLRAAPDAVPDSRSLAEAVQRGDIDSEAIRLAVAELALDFRQSERLRDVAEALSEMRLAAAAEELRKLGAEISAESAASILEIQQVVLNAAENLRPGLEPLTDDLVDMASALRNPNVSSAQAAIEEVAADFEGLDEEIYKQESTLDQLAPGNERRAEQDGNAAGAAIPDTRDFPQTMAGTDGIGASGGKAEAGPREGRPTSLAVKLQQEGLRGLPTAGISRVDVEEATRQSRAKLDYRNVKSDLTPAQKDVLSNENIPWKYRTLIRMYFDELVEPASNR